MSISKRWPGSDLRGTKIYRQSFTSQLSVRAQEYSMQVLGLDFDETEDDLDRRILLAASTLGIHVSRGFDSSEDLRSSLALSGTTAIHSSESQSRRSISIEAPTYTSSGTAPSILSAPSIHAKNTPYAKIRRSFRHLSTLTRRRTDSLSKTQHIRSSTKFELPRTRPLSLESGTLASFGRSLTCRALQELRVRQLAEQERFIRYERKQLREVSGGEFKEMIVRSHREKQENLREKHAETLADIEHRHLAAEVELVRTLDMEWKACEARLKHMEAYCSKSSGRKVTDQDRKMLFQQYQVRNTMDNLHKARINVLREKQAKQLERILGKQEVELEKVSQDMNDLFAKQVTTVDEVNIRQEFVERRKRLISRWELMEAIERQKLENETGLVYGPLPLITWPQDLTSDGAYDEPLYTVLLQSLQA
ncbi:MAG: hypothetical protein MMC33_004943 [Icmadophila ericetorum]|nr:hypothetical protein [Icmadophila ericetorum]